MYGGMTGETAKSRQAVAQTQGIVLTYGPGYGVIFKAYFSSCCGGVTQAASDAFPGEPYIPPLAEQSHGDTLQRLEIFQLGSDRDLQDRTHPPISYLGPAPKPRNGPPDRGIEHGQRLSNRRSADSTATAGQTACW